MDTFLFLITFASFFWLVAFVPFNVLVMLTALIHGRAYAYTMNDTTSGIAIGILLLYGSPVLNGLHELKNFIRY